MIPPCLSNFTYLNFTMKRILFVFMAIAAMFSSCKESAPVNEEVTFSVYDQTGETPKSVDVTARGLAKYNLKIISSASWTVSVKEGTDWITLSQTSGVKGAAQVTITVAENPDELARTGRIEFVCGNKSVNITFNQEKASPKDEEVVVPPVSPTAPVADLLDVVFKSDGSAIDNSVSQMKVDYVSGSAAVSYFHDKYQRYATHFNHKLASEMSGGYYKIDYTSNTAFRNALADGHTLEVVFRMDQVPNGSEIKPFSSMQSGGTGFLITNSSKGMDITFLPNVNTSSSSSWKWAQSGVVPEVGRYYHVVGVWNKQNGTASVFVDGVKKGEVAAAGNLIFPTEGNTWFCVGGDPSGSGAHAGFNGDVVLARIYDDPLTASQISDLYSIVKNDVKSEVVAATDLSYLAEATVAHGCWYYLYSNAFKSGDKLSLESVSKSNVKLDCETVYESGFLKLQVPSSLTAGKYLVCLTRGETKTPLGYADMKVADKIQQVNKTGIVAHRGYHPGSVPENSLASLIEAQKLGVYGSEFDVYVTLDDVVVLYHNATFSGTEKAENAAFKGKRVDSFRYDEIKNYKLANGENLPTLNDYLTQAQKYPNTKLILEIKSHDTAAKNMKAAEACFNLVKNMNMQHQVEYIAFSYDICKKLVQLDPNAMVQYLNGDKAPKTVLADGIRGIDYTSSKLTDAYIKEANELGMTVNVWTVNSQSSMLDFMNKGVDLITTDESEIGMKLVGKPFVAMQ